MAIPPDSQPAILFLHAHPDDEAMLTGCALAKAHATGMRTIVVYGTRGEAGQTGADLGGETLGERRAREATLACAELGVSRVEWLPYIDSGMAGTETTEHPSAFCNADVECVVGQLEAMLASESIIAVVGYDANGTYGHPDHVQVYRVAHALAALLPSAWLLDATYDREYLADLPEADGTIDPGFVSARVELTHFVQGEPWFRSKMEAIKCHTSQAPSSKQASSKQASSKQASRNQAEGTSTGPGRGIDRWRARSGTEWFIARPPVDPTALGRLDEILEPADAWPGPLSRPPR